MALDTNTRLAIQAKLRLGTPPKEVSEQLDIKLSTVYAIHQKMKATKADEVVDELNNIPLETITHIVEEAKVLAPVQAKELDAVVSGIDGLKKLDKSFQTTMTGVLKRFDLMLLDQDLELKDIVIISNTTANAYEKVFAAGTNIHIGDNNQNNSNQLTIFKNKQGV